MITVTCLILLALMPEAPDQRAERQAREQREKEVARVWVTTDRGVVAGCEKLGGLVVSDGNDLDYIRRSAAGRGADVIRLQCVRDDQIAAEIFRCADWDPSNPPTQTPTPTEESIQRQREFERMKSRVKIIRDPALAAGCEKRGERVIDSRDDGEDALRGNAVATRSNVLLLQPVQDARLFGVFYRCPARELEAIGASAPTSPDPTPAPRR